MMAQKQTVSALRHCKGLEVVFKETIRKIYEYPDENKNGTTHQRGYGSACLYTKKAQHSVASCFVEELRAWYPGDGI